MSDVIPYAIAANMTKAERRVIGQMQHRGWYTAKELRTTGALMSELWDWRRDARGIAAPIQLVFRDRCEPEGAVIWEISDLGRSVKKWVWRFDEEIEIDGREYKRFIPYPGSVTDGTSRCIQCGQIDDEPWHDAELCASALKRDGEAGTP